MDLSSVLEKRTGADAFLHSCGATSLLLTRTHLHYRFIKVNKRKKTFMKHESFQNGRDLYHSDDDNKVVPV